MIEGEIRSYLEIAGGLAVVCGLFFVGYELRQTNDLAYAEMTAWMEEARLLQQRNRMDFAEVWSEGCSGNELDGVQQVVFDQFILDEFVIVSYRVRRAGQYRRNVVTDSSTYVSNLVNYLERCPPMIERFMSKEPKYWLNSPDFLEQVRAEISRRGHSS